MPNEGSTRVGKVCHHQMYGVSCIIEKHSPAGISPGQEECRGAPHPPTCAKPSPHPHRLTDTVAGLVGGAGQLDVHSHRLQAEQLNSCHCLEGSAQLASDRREAAALPHRHPLSLPALSSNTHRSSSFPASLKAVHLPRPGCRDCGHCWCDLPG